MYRKLSVMALLVMAIILVPFQTVPSQAQNDELPYIEYDECPFLIPNTEIEGETIECGYLITLENPNDPNSEFIEVAFALLYSLSDNPAAEPIVYLEGGPGGSGILTIDSWIEYPLRDHWDILLIDQRGTGYSWPSLNCEEEEYESDDEDADPSADCLNRLLDEGVDVGSYNTVNSAQDIAEIILALDYPQANLFGISYGTRLALAIMRDYPDVVRSVIIDSVYPQAVNAYEEEPLNTQRVFDALFAYCVADAACNSAYPTLEADFYTAVDTMNTTPAVLYDAEYDEEYELSGDDFIETLFSALYDTSIIPVLPAVITITAEGDYQSAMDIITYGPEGAEFEFPEYDYYDNYSDDEFDEYAEISDSLGDAEGIFYALECQEEIAYNNIDVAYTFAENVSPEIAEQTLNSLAETFGLCEIWNVTTAPAVENQQVVSSLPTLVLAGDLDPVTPPAWAQLAASTLSNSYYVEFPGVGHSTLDNNDCGMGIAMAFLQNPTQAPDTSCVAAMTGPNFYIR